MRRVFYVERKGSKKGGGKGSIQLNPQPEATKTEKKPFPLRYLGGLAGKKKR